MHLEVRLALLDIEGTVSPLAFVRDSMFPYAAARYSHYLSTHWQDPACVGAVALLRTDAAAENPPLHADDFRFFGPDPGTWAAVDAAAAAAAHSSGVVVYPIIKSRTCRACCA